LVERVHRVGWTKGDWSISYNIPLRFLIRLIGTDIHPSNPFARVMRLRVKQEWDVLVAFLLRLDREKQTPFIVFG
jgi:hypothetical protein